jgi:hypothetical protein
VLPSSYYSKKKRKETATKKTEFCCTKTEGDEGDERGVCNKRWRGRSTATEVPYAREAADGKWSDSRNGEKRGNGEGVCELRERRWQCREGSEEMEESEKEEDEVFNREPS